MPTALAMALGSLKICDEYPPAAALKSATEIAQRLKTRIIQGPVGMFLPKTEMYDPIKEEAVPKPKSHLRLDYPVAKYSAFSNTSGNCSFSFDINESSKVKMKQDCSMEIQYPKMKATIYLNYKPVNKAV